MSKTFPILLHPHTTLKAKAKPVAKVDDEIRAKLDAMLATLYRADGVGLAANQVGLLDRLVVIDLGVEGKDGKRDYAQKRPIFFVNPEITDKSADTRTMTEGCLSLPHVWGEVTRPATVTVDYLDRDGAKQTLVAEGLMSSCIQHEIDHLDGVIFPDRMSKVRRDMALKKWTKIRKDVVAHGDNFDVLAEEIGVIKAMVER